MRSTIPIDKNMPPANAFEIDSNLGDYLKFSLLKGIMPEPKVIMAKRIPLKDLIKNIESIAEKKEI